MRLIIARCEVSYVGRLTTVLPEAVRMLMIKPDGTFMVWSDGGGPNVKPLNWMSPPSSIAEQRGKDGALERMVVRKHKLEDRLEVTVTEVIAEIDHELDTSSSLEKAGVERELQELLAEQPERCQEGLRLVRREWPTDIGPVDLMCRDCEEEWIAVEIKRIGTIDSVEQLSRYLERIRLDPALSSCKGILAAQVIKPQARVLAGSRGIDCVEVDIEVLRGEREPDLTLFCGIVAQTMSDEDPPAVLSERRGNALVITLNRPQVRNAVNAAVAAGVAKALDELDQEPSLAVGVLTGAGGFFCAGMDLGAFVKGESPWFGDRGFAGIAMRASKKPLIAAIEGFAVAGGLEVALACDLIVAAKGAKLGIPESKRSLVAAGGALLRLPKRMPYHVVMELALTGDPMSAERFHEFGVVNRLAEPGSALDVALELAAALAKNGPLALAASKQILESQVDWSSEQMWDEQAAISGPVFASEDAKEGASAFKEKRDPVWKGR